MQPYCLDQTVSPRASLAGAAALVTCRRPRERLERLRAELQGPGRSVPSSQRANTNRNPQLAVRLPRGSKRRMSERRKVR